MINNILASLLITATATNIQPLAAQNNVSRTATWTNGPWQTSETTNTTYKRRLKYLSYNEYSFANIQGKAIENNQLTTNNGSIVINNTVLTLIYKVELTLPQTWQELTNKFSCRINTNSKIVGVPWLSDGYYLNPTNDVKSNLDLILSSTDYAQINTAANTLGTTNSTGYVANPTNTNTYTNRQYRVINTPTSVLDELESYTPSQNNVTLQTNDEIYLYEQLTLQWTDDATITTKENALSFTPNQVTNNYVWEFTPSTNYEVIDIGGIMLQILSMPWSFISTAFNVTLFPATPYEINIANLAKGIIGICAVLFIVSLFTKGFSAIGSYIDAGTTRKLNREKLKGQRLANERTAAKTENTRINTEGQKISNARNQKKLDKGK